MNNFKNHIDEFIRYCDNNEIKTNEILIGSFAINSNVEIVTEEFTVGKFSAKKNVKSVKNMEYSVKLYKNEGGGIPHIHIESKDGKCKIAVRLRENKTFIHDSCNKFPKTNQTAIWKALNEFLKQPCVLDRSKTNWEYCIYFIMMENEEFQQCKNKLFPSKMPDYSKTSFDKKPIFT